ncbi:serine/threonine protein phosphatase [Williamsoniiplasma somnilux]|uniref:Serine/threonine protein phosphatase n=1 Tax=Williamsoniiplasma somnilux TaxID=215578 RepID=A0A2K8NYV6_9MOLU|nr:formylglycine-generating enzyme family protein [Williamsoniiplasma somnilux]ATZ18736.1 serine/threonine protein phosphatase [Williamsoniiplasma somnilux]
MIKILGNSFLMGSKNSDSFKVDNSQTIKSVKVESFFIDETPVTNLEFQKFIQDTSYITEAEKYNASFVFTALLDEKTKQKSNPVDFDKLWYYVQGANWKNPEGPHSDIKTRMNHPVVHVSRNDAIEYCNWSGKRLLTEAEWEYAARGGLENQKFPWGNELLLNEEWNCNIWQGEFPFGNTKEDGFLGTAPVKTFKPNNYGLYQMVGNVWEWCSNPKDVDYDYFNQQNSHNIYNANKKQSNNFFAIRGGSFLCHDKFCKRYKVYSRNSNSAESTSSNLSFRCAKSIT